MGEKTYGKPQMEVVKLTLEEHFACYGSAGCICTSYDWRDYFSTYEAYLRYLRGLLG